MNTAVTHCPRCTGVAGAHFAFCFIAQLWERLMGPGYPWAPQAAEEIPLPEEPLYEPGWDWSDTLHIPGPWDDDPPDPQGVAEDTAVAMGAPSDADWLPDGMWMPADDHDWEQWHTDRQLDQDVHAEAVTHLPEGYYDQEPDEPEGDGWSPDGWDRADDPEDQSPSPEPRKRNTEGMRRYKEEQRKTQEDTAVLFIYDCCEFTPGGRVPLTDLHSRFVVWQEAGQWPSMSKDRMRNLLVEVGLSVEPGRLPGMRAAGKAPLLVHGITMRSPVAEVVPEPPVVVTLPEPQREKHALIGAKPGGELPKQVRELIEPLITVQGWEYQPNNGNGRGRPRVKSPAGKVCTLPSTPHLQGHTLENTRSFLKQNGALL